MGKTHKFSTAIVACPLHQHECFLKYKTIYVPSIVYGFEASCFNIKQCNKLIALLNPQLLPRMGFHRSTPKAVVFATAQYQGVGLLHPQAEQLVAKIKWMMKHLRLNQGIGKIIAITFKWAQICNGTSSHILQDTRLIPHLEG
eukprot:5157643-Ditylum_brightwellii.AAC.1